MWRCSKTSGKRGILLYEVMVTVAILSLGLVIVLRSFLASLQAARTSQNYLRATYILEEKLWELKRAGVSFTEESGDELLGEEGEFRWEVEVAELSQGQLNELREVTLTVFWREGGKEKRLETTTTIIVRQRGNSSFEESLESP